MSMLEFTCSDYEHICECFVYFPKNMFPCIQCNMHHFSKKCSISSSVLKSSQYLGCLMSCFLDGDYQR
jgi:hypothetical protein